MRREFAKACFGEIDLMTAGPWRGPREGEREKASEKRESRADGKAKANRGDGIQIIVEVESGWGREKEA